MATAAPGAARQPVLGLSRGARPALVVLCAGIAVLSALAGGHVVATDLDVVLLAAFLVSPVAATVLLDARPGHPLGLLLTALGVAPVAVLLAATRAEGALPGLGRVALEAPHLLVVLAVVGGVGVPLVVTGEWPGDLWGRATAWAAAGAVGVGLAAWVLRVERQPDLVGSGLSAAQGVVLGCTGPLVLSALAWRVVQWTRSEGLDRRRQGWFLLGSAAGGSLLAVVATTSAAATTTYVTSAVVAAAPVALVGLLLARSVPRPDVALLRIGLLLLEVGLLAGVYATAVSALGRSSLPDPTAAAVVTTALVALALVPLHVLARDAGLERLYGTARPASAMVALSRSVDAAHEVQASLVAAAAAAAAAVRSPGARVVLGEEADDAPASAAVVPLLAGGARLGALIVAPRRPGEPFARRDLDLLAVLATPVAQLLRAVLLTQDLERARGDAVAQRLAERRRLRRDLHDSVGPLLAGLGLQAAAVQRSTGDPRLGLVTDAAASCRHEIRRLVDDLERDDAAPADLEAAVRELLADWSSATVDVGLDLVLEVDGPLPELDAAVRLAAYRIVGEALTNVVQHAAAGRCRVRLGVDGDELVVEVRDDGSGPAGAPDRTGVGVRSMTDRARALGGDVELTGYAGSGTVLRARLPRRGTLP